MEALGFKEGIARFVCPLLLFEIMRFTIELDDQFDREAGKVGDVIPERGLAES